MGKDHCGRHLSVGCVRDLRGRDHSRGHAHDRYRECVHGYDRDHVGSQDRERELLVAWGLLRNVIAGDYLAFALKVHAASKHPAGFYFALQFIRNRLVRIFEHIDDAF